MKHWWWKILAVLLLFYTAFIGLRTPLSPALVSCSPDRIQAGEVTVFARGYNTDFQEGTAVVYIENDGQRICATSHEALSPDSLVARFQVLEGLRAELSDLCVRVGTKTLRYPGAFYTENRGQGIAEELCGGGKSFELLPAMEFPNRNILNESIRNLFFHVPMWFTMVVLMAIGVWKSVRVLSSNDLGADRSAVSAVQVGLLFGVLGLITGSLWARVTWETWWTKDPKLNGAAAGVLIYLAYLVLRSSVQDDGKRARLAAIYSIFAFAFMLLFFFVLPRLNAVDSLHPGNGGNPAFNTYDLDNRLRAVFYPACLGWILLGCWMYDLRVRAARLSEHFSDHG